ncbi:MAG: aldo/keto reductase [Elusimicrobia bacterium]|nr:aldo/keto reductase [Elusimicrobiota bacterium]
MNEPTPAAAALKLNRGPKEMPALGFGTLIEGAEATRAAVSAALQAGYRLIDCAEQHRNESAVGAALKQAFAGGLKRDDVFVSTKLWNSNHRPERVKDACEASLRRLGLERLDLYLVHTPFAFQPGRDEPEGSSALNGYDMDMSLPETWSALEQLVAEGKCGAIGLSNVGVDRIEMICGSASVKPSVVQVEAHPYLPQDGLLAECRGRGVVLQAYAPLAHGHVEGPLENVFVKRLAEKLGCTPAQVLLAWALARGTAALTSSRDPRRIRESRALPALDAETLRDLTLSIVFRRRFNRVTETGVPSFDAPPAPGMS